MRIYRTDGSFIENLEDTAFGWTFSDVTVKEDCSKTEEIRRKSMKTRHKEAAFMESVDIVEPEKPLIVKHVKVNVKTEKIVNVIDCKMEVEGPPIKVESKRSRELKNINFTAPPKEELAKMINPCNTETKALLSVIFFAKYKSLMKKDISEELFQTVNVRTTNFKCLINDRKQSISKEMIKDIQHYEATKEENMLSLMMELILADIDCNLEDIVDVDEGNSKETNTDVFLETSDLGNSIQSKDLSSYKSSYVDAGDRDSILSSIGLSDEDRSLRSFCEETLEMRLQTAQIRESFQEESNRVNDLIKTTAALRNELRETLYLDDILHLLKGDVEKVKLKKLPFKVFFKDHNGNGSELNLIV